MAEYTDFEALKFLVDCSFKEADLFWKRNTVFLTVSLASFGASFAYLSGNSEPVELGVRILIVFLGSFLCIVWICNTQAGRRMNHLWIDQAKILSRDIGCAEIENAIKGTPSNSISHSPLSATKLMVCLAIGFIISWVLIAVFIGKGGYNLNLLLLQIHDCLVNFISNFTAKIT